MTVRVCDRCGEITVEGDRCLCATPFDPFQVRRRHRDAVARARTADAHEPHPSATRGRRSSSA